MFPTYLDSTSPHITHIDPRKLHCQYWSKLRIIGECTTAPAGNRSPHAPSSRASPSPRSSSASSNPFSSSRNYDPSSHLIPLPFEIHSYHPKPPQRTHRARPIQSLRGTLTPASRITLNPHAFQLSTPQLIHKPQQLPAPPHELTSFLARARAVHLTFKDIRHVSPRTTAIVFPKDSNTPGFPNVALYLPCSKHTYAEFVSDVEEMCGDGNMVHDMEVWMDVMAVPALVLPRALRGLVVMS